ncbi:TonB-dependent receptor domain-containing protein [Steroidobacter sp.]|uniref:TonB-dependent receptor domain-containing protein n=1 Tax=Steroidobacter sp. TaxID=1978227 RepID=UPI001A3CD2E3|nr:TonB-dependent receptor [Steroidobacter sp.]MBL8268728.1 TonB-dependent receptor [Steroidobacter sp.]
MTITSYVHSRQADWCVLRGALVGASILLASATVHSATPSTLQSQRAGAVVFDIPAQSLATALLRFSEQAGIQVTAPSATLQVFQTPGVRGDYTAVEALDILLKGSGLTYKFVDAETVVVRGAHTAAHTSGTMRLAQAGAGSEAAKADGQQTRSMAEEEVIVTAQRRGEESLQNVPISMSVISGQELDKSHSLGVLGELSKVPGVGLYEATQTGGASVSIRGASVNYPLFSGASTVGYYIDDIPFGFVSSAVLPDAGSFDLARVEVLRGPQGTLYGANALNGVVLIKTSDPDLEAFGLKARTLLSSTEDGGENYRGDLSVNIPIVSGKVAARATAGFSDYSGWIDRPNAGVKDANDREVTNLRLKLKAQVTDDLSFTLSGWHSKTQTGSPDMGLDGRVNASARLEPLSFDYDVLGAVIDYRFADVAMRSATSYIDYQNDSELDLRYIPNQNSLFTDLGAKVFAQEFTFNSTSTGPWGWSGGAMYRDAKDTIFQQFSAIRVEGPGIFPFANDEYRSESIAVYGELSRRFMNDRLQLSLGARYFRDTVSVDNLNTAAGPVEDTFEKVTPRTVLSWFPSDDAMFYASYAQGFRSGRNQNELTLAVVPDLPAADPDSLNSYEVGSKGRWFDGGLKYDVAVFYIDWKDLQLSRVVVPPSGPTFSALTNGQSASGVGTELRLGFEPIRDLNVDLNFAWNDLAFDSKVFTNGILWFDKGDRLVDSVKYNAGLSLDYAFPTSSRGWNTSLLTSVNYTSPRLYSTVSGPRRILAIADDVILTRLELAVEAPANWTISLFADNLFDEDPVVTHFPFNPQREARIRPRTIGVQLEYRL